MDNKSIANIFNTLARIMELHEENAFRIRSYANAYITLRKVGTSLTELSRTQLEEIPGIGKTIAEKIIEFRETGTLEAYEKYRAKTPPGVIEMLTLKGFGPKKIGTIWRDLGAETIGELLYACQENRLVALPGFGAKTQEDLISKLNYFLASQGQFLYATVESRAEEILNELKLLFPDNRFEFAGKYRQKNPTIEVLEIITNVSAGSIIKKLSTKYDIDEKLTFSVQEMSVRLMAIEDDDFDIEWLKSSSSEGFAKKMEDEIDFDTKGLTETDIFNKMGAAFVYPEMRELPETLDKAKIHALPELIQLEDIKGVIHTHSTWSDGIHAIKEMADFAIRLGYEYLVISDHSKSAFYANGLQVERVQAQWAEIDILNKQYSNFKIYKGIESDILNDGSLDYDDDILQGFDIVIASVHSNLKMDEVKATDRLLKAIQNSHTRILGHPTGRLLLSRAGYPIDHQVIIQACAEHEVVIELNANPHRLDIDWGWIPYALDHGVMIAINPDAHSKEKMRDIKYGIFAARKGGLQAQNCLNNMGLRAFEEWITK